MSTQQQFSDNHQLNDIQSARVFTPQRQIYTSQSKRSARQSSIPKSLQIELKRQRDTFMTEISYNTDHNNFSNNSQFFNQNNYSTRNISTAASGSRSKILQSRKPIDFAIKTFQNASTRLEKFFNSAYMKTDQNDKDDDVSDLENFKIKTTPKSLKKGLEHGILRKGTFKRSTTSSNLAVTLQHIPILLDSLDQMDKEEQ